MQVQTNALGVNGEAAFFIKVGKAGIRLDGEMRLTLSVVITLNHIRSGIHDGFSFFTLGERLFKVNVRGSRMDLNGVIRHGIESIHVSWQLF
ncbi:hypothetical protein SDC9_99673 [bioreactor metagenome]|uniref:Uncharacterized protein n=1 Tax=bioreactor metagenome TaxID=1076179 RepID=A0A645AIA9_9ZZZZ